MEGRGLQGGWAYPDFNKLVKLFWLCRNLFGIESRAIVFSPASEISHGKHQNNTQKFHKNSGPDEIRTHDLPVISRAHHLAMLRAQFNVTLIHTRYPYK